MATVNSTAASANPPKTSVGHRCSAYNSMWEDWQLIRALAGGTRSMRRRGGEYLPSRPLESEPDYKHRLGNAVLTPVFSETCENLTGRIFAQTMIVNDDVPTWIKTQVIPNIDRMGRDINVFANEFVLEAMEYGLAHVLIDAPELPPGTPQDKLTLQQQIDNKIRPYVIRVHAENVIGWQEVDGELTQLRVTFSETVQDGEWAQRHVETVRVYDSSPGEEQVRVRVFVKAQASDVSTATPQYMEAPDRARVLPIPRIPLVTLYTDRTGYLQANPPMREVAFLNAKHWRLKSMLDELLETVSVAILCTTGVDTNDKIVIGARHVVKLPANADMKYVEHQGAALGSLQNEIVNTLEDMRQAGGSILKPLNKRTGRTNTEVNDEIGRETSQLGLIVKSVENAMSAIFDTMGLFWSDHDNNKSAGTVTCRPNLNPDEDPGRSIDNLMKLGVGGVLSRQTIFETARGNGVFNSEIQWDDEQARIEADGLPQNPEDQPIEDANVDPPTKPASKRAARKSAPTKPAVGNKQQTKTP